MLPPCHCCSTSTTTTGGGPTLADESSKFVQAVGCDQLEKQHFMECEPAPLLRLEEDEDGISTAWNDDPEGWKQPPSFFQDGDALRRKRLVVDIRCVVYPPGF